MINMSRLVTRTDLPSTNTGAGAWSGSAFVVNAATASDWLWSVSTPIVGGAHIAAASTTVSVPSGYATSTLAQALLFRDASGTILASAIGPDVAISTAAVALTTPPMTVPPTATRVEQVTLMQSGAATNRRITYVSSSLVLDATADEIVGGSLTRAQNRADADSGTGRLILTQGVPGPRSGSLTYLCSDWSQVSAIDAIYRTGAVRTPETGPLPALTHYAIGDLRSTLERALPGRPAKWLVTVNFREDA